MELSPHAPPLDFLVGPTAAGKSDLALAVAERLGAEILSMDSMLVYRGMDVGTAKPTAPMRARVRHHLLDLVEPTERFTVQRYLAHAELALADVRSRGRRALFVGGTGLYLKTLSFGLFDGPEVDPEIRERLERRYALEGGAALHAELARVDASSAERVHARDRKRVVRALEVFEQTGRPLSSWQSQWNDQGGAGRPRRIVGIDVAAEELDRRIVQRAHAMLAAGWVDEVRAIAQRGGFGPTAGQALGYRPVIDLAEGRIDCATCVERVALATRQFARRQRTWFRKFPEIVWLAPSTRDPAELLDGVLEVLGIPGAADRPPTSTDQSSLSSS